MRCEPKLDQPYMVLYRRDSKTEQAKEYGQKMLFDNAQSFLTRQEAEKFASYNLPAIISKRHPLTSSDKRRARGTETPYLVAAKFNGKYRRYDYTGDSDPLTTYDAIRCNESDIERIVQGFNQEGAEQIMTGIELMVF